MPRRPTVSRTRSSSSAYSQASSSGSAELPETEDDVEAADRLLRSSSTVRRTTTSPSHRKSRSRLSSKRNTNGTSTSPSSQYQCISIFLLTGLAFCLLDSLYIFRYIVKDSAPVPSESVEASTGMEQVQTTQTNEQKAVSSDTAVDSPPKKDTDENAQQEPQVISNQQDDPDTTTLHTDDETIDDILNDPDRAPIVKLLHDAQVNLTALELETLRQLPKWSDVTSLYGSEPVISGLETCEAFQRLPDPAEHFVSTAGTFNTGTNLMAELLIRNCYMPARTEKYGMRNRGVRWQVLWGKHTPVFDEDFRLHHRTYNDSTLQPQNMFPAVMVRDPFKWMQSMCRHEYGAHWEHNQTVHCPNLVPNDGDRALWQADNVTVDLTKTGGIPVTIHYKEFEINHDTLVGFWNDWYREYSQVKWPRLLVRFEDLIFYPQQVTKTVCECAGGKLLEGRPFQFVVESAKRGIGQHGSKKERTTYIDALVKYGTEKGRYNGYDEADLEYAKQHLSPELLELFQYKLPTAVSSSRT